MKKNILINGCVVLAAMSMMTSCEDFLDEKPQSTYTTETFYTSEKDFAYAVSAIYAAQQEIWEAPDGKGEYSMLRFPSTRADECSRISTNLYDGGAGAFTDKSDCVPTGYIWKYMYIIINRANGVLDRIDAFSFESDETKNQLKGQALALRGWAYNQLGIYFGGVPLILKEVTPAEARQIGRSSQAETFAQAIKDYTDGAALLPDVWTGDNYGRVGKLACEAMMGRLCLFMGDKSAAQGHLKKVMDSGKFGFAPTYVDCFNEDGEGNAERIWEVVYLNNTPGEGQRFSEGFIQEGYSHTPGHDHWDYCVGNGGSHAMDVNIDFYNSFEAGDLRLNEYQDNVATRVGMENIYCLKYNHYNTKPTQSSYWGVNLPIIRYTDVALMYAECVGEGEGKAIVNAVRQRAGLGDYTGDFTTALRNERWHEFAFEGLRWFDLVRWNTVGEVINALFATVDGGNGANKLDNAENRKIFAIPQTEIDLYNNKDLMPQNPGF